jgi:SAM-dependent methyltransferase
MRSQDCIEARSEVDRIAEVYRGYGQRRWGETKWAVTNKGNQCIRREREQKLERLLGSAGFLPLGQARILDVGCGTGENLAGFKAWSAKPPNLFGIDLLGDRVRRAKESFPEMTFRNVNAEALPFANGSFDLVAVFTVFSSILDDQMARNVSREIDRVLCRGGAVVWYDFRINNPFNQHVRGISKRMIRSLFPGFDLRLVTLTLLPPLARRLGRTTSLFYGGLTRIPLLRSHYLGLLTKP